MALQQSRSITFSLTSKFFYLGIFGVSNTFSLTSKFFYFIFYKPIV
jgi:hypothetical protein